VDDLRPALRQRLAARSVAPKEPKRKRRALVIEADPATQRMCRNILESSGFAVDAVDRGIAAVVAARAELPDLILIDLELPDVPGREAIGWLRSNPALRSTPIILLAGNENYRDVAAISPGAVLRKPLSPPALQQTVQRFF